MLLKVLMKERLYMILVIDNYDSFTYNLVDLLSGRHKDVKVIKNDEMTSEEIISLSPDGILISPGPGTPEESGVCVDIIKKSEGLIPILGVCLGHQAIGTAYGAKVTRAAETIHGKSELLKHDGVGLFEGIPGDMSVIRYHSLVISKDSMPDDLEALSYSTSDNEIMAVKHKLYEVYGVQFHPESYGSKYGEIIIENFLKIVERKSKYA